MVKAIIFDCFGVLATEAWLSFKAKYFAHDPELFKRASELSWQANSGLVSYEDFTRGIAKLASITPAEAHKAITRNVPDEQLFAYARELRTDYKLGLLSNIAANRLHQMFTVEQLGLFNVIALSFENGFVKPEAQAFTNVAKQLGVDISECVFIDDQQLNVEGSRTAGMLAILYHDINQLKRELDPLLKP